MTARKTPAPKQALSAREKERAKQRLIKARQAVKDLKKKTRDAEKTLAALQPKKKTGPIRGLVKAAKAAADSSFEKAIGKTRKTVPVVADRSIKPIEFIDGLCSTNSYLIVSEKRDNKAIRLGVRFTDNQYRLHFYPSVVAHLEDRPEGLPHGKMRYFEGYETVWVNRFVMENVLNTLQQRDDTNFLPLQLVTKMVAVRDKQGVSAALAA